VLCDLFYGLVWSYMFLPGDLRYLYILITWNYQVKHGVVDISYKYNYEEVTYKTSYQL
jgi:hypothetical protein